MVDADINEQAHTGRIILRPNRSWSWRANLALLYTLMTVSLGIAAFFLFMGAWVVLPYTLLEMLVLGAALYYCARQCERQEVITVSDHEVQVEKGIRLPDSSWTWNRVWTHFLVSQPRYRTHTPRISVRSEGEDVEIGAFLNESDKRLLIACLRRVVR